MTRPQTRSQKRNQHIDYAVIGSNRHASRFAQPDGKYYCAILQICGTRRKKTEPKPRLALPQVVIPLRNELRSIASPKPRYIKST